MRRPIQAGAIVLLVLLLAVTSEAHACELQVESDKAVYRPGDTIVVTAEVRNTRSESVDLAVETTMRDLRGKFPASSLLYRVGLAPNETRRLELFRLLVDERFYSGAYVVSVSLIEGGFRVYEEEIRFSVEGAPEDMQVEVLLCRDPACTERSLVFVRNEKMYIAYRCSVEEVSITADLTFPDNSSRQLMLPANLTVKQAGSYTIRVKASAEGYRNVTLTEYFAVLEKEPELLQVEKKPSAVSLSVSKGEVAEGETIEVHGAISPPHAGANVTLVYSRDGKSQATRAATTDDEGRFSDVFTPQPAGEWSLVASWTGDSNHLSAQSQELTFKVTPLFPTSLVIGVAAAAVIVVVVVALMLSRRRR
jgi:hypothetical protein